ncbi:MAG: 2Fe-2S iron-sulfur cluster binding domain-containing protein, partial [Gemmatimonadetes bacterium]|nr:2Fe-2S iron-sulfur cluster binding domain-containing protein [Gemmatimonadota bacterium]
MIALLVNGERRNFDADPAMPLLWVLRDLLNLKGTKYACGAGLCGSCTVHVDGEPVRSCITTVDSVAGKAVTTIEGLAEDQRLHPVQAAWVGANTPQC